ncbi:PAS domain S-box protein [Nodosilinea sp. AN01ver1]|uniref:PAS domain-containing hybrid sensor histidine kinase/response regulator n=1 Tax=Nodosilinea sp. AN01ver1 TaxID=3423362 RepID=UPI003D31915D
MAYTILSEHSGTLLPTLSQAPLQLDGILLELDSPYNRSLQLLRHLKEQTSAPVIVIDGGDTEVAVQAFKSGAVDYLVKGRATPDDLRLAMRTAIENAELKRELQRSQETFRTSVENMLDCFGIFSAMRNDTGQIVDFCIDYLNEAACVNNQMPKAMQIGRGLCEVLPAHRDSGLFDEYCRVVETGEPLIKESLVYDDTYGDRRLVRAFDIRATRLNDGFVASWRDVTARKQLELELSQTVADLQASQQYNRDLTEAMPQMVWTADSTGAVTYWNRAWYEYTGLNEAESLGIAGVSTVHPQERDRVLSQWSHAVSQGQSFEMEYRLRHREGDYRWFICRATPNRDRQAQVTGWIGTITDIDQQKQSALALQQSQERLELAMRAASMGSWDWNIQTGEVSWSTNLEHLFDMAAGGFDGRYETVRAMMHPDDLPRVEQALQRALYGREEYNIEFRFIKPDGTVRWALGLGRVFYDEAGHPVMMTGVDMDISHRKQVEAALTASETRLRSIADNAPVKLWVTDPSGYCTDLNQRWYDFTGQTEATALGFGWLDAVHPDDSASARATFLRANERQESFRLEYRLRHHSGQYHWAIDAANPYFGDDGEFKGFIGAVIDISDRKQAEEALRQSERALQENVSRFRTLADNIAQLAWMANETGWIFWYNQRWFDYTGTTQDDMQGWGWQQVHHPDHVERVVEKISRCFATGEIWEDTFPLRGRDGEYRWFLSRAVPIRDQQGRVLRWFGTNTDITEVRQANAALAANEARLRGFVDANVVGILYGDIYGNINAANDELLRIVGYTQADVQAGRLRWVDITPPEYFPLDEQGVAEARLQGACTPYEKEYIRKDGSRVPVLIGYSLVGEAREETVVFVLDLSDRKQAEDALRQSEERYRCLTESIPQLVWTADGEGRLLDVNQRWTEFTGLALEAACAAGWEAVVHPEDVPTLTQRWTAAVQQGRHYQAEGRMRRGDGTYRWFLHQAIAQRDEQGRIVKWFGTATDIDVQKQLELDRYHLLQQEQAAREAAERANRIKDEFLAVLSHELRSPLNPILGWARLLQSRTFDAAKTAEALATIERNAKLQTQLIDDLLDVAKILRGKLVMEMATVDLTFVIESAIDTVRAAAAAKSVQLHPVLPYVGQVSGDSVRLQQVVWNLLSNAIKFTPPNGRVDVRLERVGNEAQITVRDTGKGINPDFLPHLFESFRQEDASTTRNFGGLGLGLAIARSLVEAHGGSIAADSPGEGLGATFTLQLPLLDGQPEVPQPEQPGWQTLDLTGVRVLAVDDEPDARELVVTVLTLYGAEVWSATSATEALVALEAFRPDVLVSDIGMPELDGHSLIQQIRALPPERGGQIPAIALTAYAREEDHQRALTSGFQIQVTKPLELERLVRGVMTLVNRLG